MSIYPIVKYGEPVLHKRAAAVTVFDQNLKRLIDDMFETLKASRGVGLAAPQIGVDKQIFVYAAEDDTGVFRSGVFVNPTLAAPVFNPARPDPDTESEGCLSVPGLSYPLKRAPRATLTGFDQTGERITLNASGWFARIMQHEWDHLQGTLYVDRLQGKWARHWKKDKSAEGLGVPGQSWLPGSDPDPFGHDD